jgi:hypothetical protein
MNPTLKTFYKKWFVEFQKANKGKSDFTEASWMEFWDGHPFMLDRAAGVGSSVCSRPNRKLPYSPTNLQVQMKKVKPAPEPGPRSVAGNKVPPYEDLRLLTPQEWRDELLNKCR